MEHLGKHALHVALVGVMLVALWVSDISLSATALIGIMVACLVVLEGGLWVIHRREERRTPVA